MKTVELVITDDAQLAIDRYTAAYTSATEHGSMTARDREECRSYAVEVVQALLTANPDAFDFVNVLAEIERRKRGAA